MRRSRRSNAIIGAVIGTAAGVTATALVNRLREDRFDGQVALVTGASRGLGLLIARELGRQGCSVAICARHDDALQRAVGLLEDEGITVFANACDVRDREAVEAFVRATAERLGPIDILVNNAGIVQVAPVADLNVSDFEDAMASMFWGSLYPTLAVLPEMRRRRRGRIVNITSIGGRISVPHLLPYGAAKFATVGLSEGLRAELARDGIAVTTVVPGLMRTGSYLNAMFGGRRRAEFVWFGLAANAPLLSSDAERAARRIVAGVRRREAEVVVGLPALLGGWVHGIAPGLTADVLGIVNRFLPSKSETGEPPVPAVSFEPEIHSRAFEMATMLGRSAARRFNERPPD